jgi:hypothetical protein
MYLLATVPYLAQDRYLSISLHSYSSNIRRVIQLFLRHDRLLHSRFDGLSLPANESGNNLTHQNRRMKRFLIVSLANVTGATQK